MNIKTLKDNLIKFIRKIKKSINYTNISHYMVWLAALIFAVSCVKTIYDISISNRHNPIEHEYIIYRSMAELKMYAVKERCVRNIQHYIDSVAPTSSLNAVEVLDACEEYNMDIVFVLAQAQLESHFGTTGIASKTNSVWNVLAYDGRTAEDINRRGHGFKHPDYSIRPYLKLLNSKYLTDIKTEYDLMENFESIHGKRYAQDADYEKKLTGIYDRMIKGTDIFDDYHEYKKYKMILNVKQ